MKNRALVIAFAAALCCMAGCRWFRSARVETPAPPPPPAVPLPSRGAEGFVPPPVQRAGATAGAAAEAGPQAAEKPAQREIFPHVRIDKDAKVVEIDGQVPVDASDPARRIYLEVLLCARNSREHETLVVTDAKPSHVHAALLLLGLQPGEPGSWRFEGRTPLGTPPRGPAVTVSVTPEGQETEVPLADWAISTQGDVVLSAKAGEELVFAGSRFLRRGANESYHADEEGTIVGLTCFGHETIAWTGMYSPDSTLETPHWIARSGVTPPAGTRVVVRIRPAQP